MKNRNLLLGLPAITLVFEKMAVGCDKGSPDDNCQ